MTVRSVAGPALVFLFLTALLAQPSKPTGGDKKPGKDDKTEAPKPPPAPFKDGRLDDGDKDKLSQAEANDLRKLVQGSPDAPAGARATAVMEKAARWYIYRLTSPELQEGREGSMSQHMEEILGGPGGVPQGRLYSSIQKSPDPDAQELARRRQQWGVVEQFRPIAIAHVEKVMELNPPIARINALRILHRFAELGFENKGNEEVADVFVRTIENPHESDAVRVWAFHGLGALFHLQTSPVTAERIKVKDPRRTDRALMAICNWLDARCKMDAGVVSQMSEDEKAGISYVRRAAVRALGNSRRPLVKDDKDGREGPIAQLLVKLISTDENNPLSPSTTWSEGIEAVIALSKLQANRSPSYQPEYTAHQVASFVAKLGTLANDDVTRENPLWRSYGLQLRGALDDLLRDAPPERGSAYVKSAVTQISNVVDNLIDSTKHRQAATELFNWTNGTPPKAKDIYGPATMP